jgi:hypothetical protein
MDVRTKATKNQLRINPPMHTCSETKNHRGGERV